MAEGYDILTKKLENLGDTVARVHDEVEKQNDMLEETNADVSATRNVMTQLTDKTKEYLQTTDNCQTGLAITLCISFLIMLVIVFFLYG